MSRKKSEIDDTELSIALDNRAFEIQLFWQRSNYFLVLMTALGIGVFTISDQALALLISMFAAVTSWYWYQTNLGSKFWQESWEVEVVALAKSLNIASFERPTADIIEQVRKSLSDARPHDPNLSAQHKTGNAVRRWIDRQIVKKPSVSHYMILLSLTSVLLWTVVSIFILFSVLGLRNSSPNADASAQQILVVSRKTDVSPSADLQTKSLNAANDARNEISGTQPTESLVATPAK